MRKFCAAVMVASGSIVLIGLNGVVAAHGLERASLSASPRATNASPPDVTAALDGDDSESLSGPYAKLITRFAKHYKIKPALADAVVRIESRYNPKARGSAGEIGLMQIKPATARLMGYKGSPKGLYKPSINLKYGMMYLASAQDLGDGSVCGTILKYNAGHGAEHMNPISRRYCQEVMTALD